MSRTYRNFDYWNKLNYNPNIKPHHLIMDRPKYICKKLYKNIDNNKRRTEDKKIINNYYKEDEF